MPSKSKIINSYTQDNGLVEITTPSWHDTCTQVSFSTDSTTGTLAVYARYFEGAEYEAVLEEDGETQVSIDLSNPQTFQMFDKWVFSILFEPTNVDVSYTPMIASGDIYRTYA